MVVVLQPHIDAFLLFVVAVRSADTIVRMRVAFVGSNKVRHTTNGVIRNRFAEYFVGGWIVADVEVTEHC